MSVSFYVNVYDRWGLGGRGYPLKDPGRFRGLGVSAPPLTSGESGGVGD